MRQATSLHPTSEKGVLVLWVSCIGEFGGAYTLGAETDRSFGEPGAEIPEVVGERRQEVSRPGATLRCSQRGRQRQPRARRRLVRSRARPPRPRTGDPSPATRGRDRVAKAYAARATLSAELGRDTGAGELAGRLG
jgi:hypothetical protein